MYRLSICRSIKGFTLLFFCSASIFLFFFSRSSFYIFVLLIPWRSGLTVDVYTNVWSSPWCCQRCHLSWCCKQKERAATAAIAAVTGPFDSTSLKRRKKKNPLHCRTANKRVTFFILLYREENQKNGCWYNSLRYTNNGIIVSSHVLTVNWFFLMIRAWYIIHLKISDGWVIVQNILYRIWCWVTFPLFIISAFHLFLFLDKNGIIIAIKMAHSSSLLRYLY